MSVKVVDLAPHEWRDLSASEVRVQQKQCRKTQIVIAVLSATFGFYLSTAEGVHAGRVGSRIPFLSAHKSSSTNGPSIGLRPTLSRVHLPVSWVFVRRASAS